MSGEKPDIRAPPPVLRTRLADRLEHPAGPAPDGGVAGLQPRLQLPAEMPARDAPGEAAIVPELAPVAAVR